MAHSLVSTFGVRKFEAANGGFYLNGERVRLMGVERMAGSNPEYGMAEPPEWIAHDHDDLEEFELRLYADSLAAGSAGPRLLRPARNSDPERSARLGTRTRSRAWGSSPMPTLWRMAWSSFAR